jgi:quercetin dioxygenase-like cupin family protein
LRNLVIGDIIKAGGHIGGATMKTTKQLLFLILAAVLFVFSATAQEKAAPTATPAPTVVYQSKFPISIQGREYDLLTIIMDFPKGSGVPQHYHGGHVLVTVLSGEMTLKENNTERTMKTGESWTESPGHIHAVVNKGEAARIAISVFLPKGAEVTTIVK